MTINLTIIATILPSCPPPYDECKTRAEEFTEVAKMEE